MGSSGFDTPLWQGDAESQMAGDDKNGAPRGAPFRNASSAHYADSFASAALSVALGRIAWPTLPRSGW